MANISTILADL
ncbi:BnaUnng04560D [Brassica napus]|uniref:BnaUnng04560D protein n=2 Tax=Brassica TaxID=3705 RepID=A0A078JVW1_BRANA|nr:BnaUnng04560D [Brassica napus]